MAKPELEPTADFYILSDLHLGEGRSPESGRYSVMEDFFHDESFSRLIDHLMDKYRERPNDLVVVLNGDVFDFLSVMAVPGEEEAAARGFTVSDRERRFGLEPTEEKSAWKLDWIAEGHIIFIQALGRLVGAGHNLEILRGNHDLELYFPLVRERLFAWILETLAPEQRAEAEQRIQYHDWFYLVPGRLYAEHGHHYEPSNSTRFPLRPLASVKRNAQNKPKQLDLPLGSLFVRYFYNRIRRSNPEAPKITSVEHYLDFIWHYDLLELVGTAKRHYPIFLSALNPLEAGISLAPTLDDVFFHREAMEKLDRETQVPGLVKTLNSLKKDPVSSSKQAMAQRITMPFVKRAVWMGVWTLGSVWMWLLIFNLIQTPALGDHPLIKATLLFLLTIFSLTALFWIGNRARRALHSVKDETTEVCARTANEIAAAAKVPVVVMGHTHYVDKRRLEHGGWYGNSGTWVVMPSPWNQLDPDARRRTFLRVQGERLDTVRWNDNGNRIDPVPLFEAEVPDIPRSGPRHDLI